MKDGLYYVYAEYNPFWIYMGWWLYAIPVEELTDNRNVDDWAQATWLNYDWRLNALFREIGLPPYDKYRDPAAPNYRPDPRSYCGEFFLKCPAGLICQISDDGHQFTRQESEKLGDYQRIVRERQLLHIANAQVKNEQS